MFAFRSPCGVKIFNPPPSPKQEPANQEQGEKNTGRNFLDPKQVQIPDTYHRVNTFTESTGCARCIGRLMSYSLSFYFLSSMLTRKKWRLAAHAERISTPCFGKSDR